MILVHQYRERETIGSFTNFNYRLSIKAFKHEKIKKKLKIRINHYSLSLQKSEIFKNTFSRVLLSPTSDFIFISQSRGTRCSIFSPSFLPLLSPVYIAPHRKVAKKDKELEMQRNGVLSCLVDIFILAFAKNDHSFKNELLKTNYQIRIN